jgi:hypothetical protein
MSWLDGLQVVGQGEFPAAEQGLARLVFRQTNGYGRQV